MNKKDLIKKIHRLALNVSRELVFYADGYEDELSTLLSKSMKENDINFLREVTNYQFSKSLGLKTDRPDFVLMPDKKYSVTKPLIVECKFGDLSKLIEGREQLLRYLYSHKNSSYDKFGEINDGIVIYWESTSIISDKLLGQKPQSPTLNLTDIDSDDIQIKLDTFKEKLGRYHYSVLNQEKYVIKEPIYNCILELWSLKDDIMFKKESFGYKIN
tara:strand:- start:9304 stop:9948 length:645 start_codon:yes stop_codon:yes gene_type:complete